jgi:predicted transcriptional regulator
MLDAQDVLISLEERHAEGIIRGTKAVELRRRRMNVAVGSVVWLYVKQPKAAVIGRARIQDTHALAPRTLWTRFAETCGLTRREFFEYFSGIKTGFAMSLSNVERLSAPITLRELREAKHRFQPPQFFMHLRKDSVLLRTFRSAHE